MAKESNVGLRIRNYRERLDMSVYDLAVKSGIDEKVINAIEKGDYNPTIKLCIAICKALDRTLDELFWE